jgi:hypothetical protein
MDKRARMKAVAKLIVPMAFIVLVYALVFTRLGFGLPCFFRWATGLLCPGCGMSHALAAMIRLDFAEAAKWNILSVTLVPVLIIFFGYRFIRYINTGKENLRPWELIFLGLCAMVCVVFFVYRNFLK